MESEMFNKLQSFSIAFYGLLSSMLDADIDYFEQVLEAFPASVADNDTMYLAEAMRQDNKDKFLEVMVKEITDHTKQGHWQVTTRAEMRRRNYHHRPIMSVWSFKRKRNPMGQI